MAPTFIYPRGATIALVWEAVGDVSQLGSVGLPTAVLKPAIAGGGVPGADEAAVATFIVTPRAASASVGPGWDLTIGAAASAALAPGVYVTNLVLPFAPDDVEISSAALIRIEQTTA